MKNFKKISILVSIFILVFICLTPVAFANSAEPPLITIIVTNPPENIEIYVKYGDSVVEASRVDKLGESYFSLYSAQLTSDQISLEIKIGDEISIVDIQKPIKNYNNIFTLNIKKMTVTEGKRPWRAVSYILVRIILTLIIEGAIFFLFGFKDKKSWIAFIIINLLTQGLLNVWLGLQHPSYGYVIFMMIFGELMVYIVEIVLFMIAIKEHRKLRVFLYVIAANTISLFVGYYLITYLPL